jgi:hypothetical protein
MYFTRPQSSVRPSTGRRRGLHGTRCRSGPTQRFSFRLLRNVLLPSLPSSDIEDGGSLF